MARRFLVLVVVVLLVFFCVEFTIHRRTDQPPHRQSARPLCQEVFRTKQLMLVPVTWHQRRRLGQRLLQVLDADDAHDATGRQPRLDAAQTEWDQQLEQQAPHRRHPAAGASGLAVEKKKKTNNQPKNKQKKTKKKKKHIAV